MALELSLEQKRHLYRDGYIILKGAVARELTQAARQRIKGAKKGESLSNDPALLDLINKSTITPILHSTMGYFDPPVACQVAVNPIRKANDSFTAIGYRDSEIPYYGASVHMDGVCTIASGIPQDPKQVAGMTAEDKYQHYINAGKDPRNGGILNRGKAPEALPGKPQIGKSCEVVGENGGVPLFQDPECTLGIGSFTGFLFIALNDQTREGCGQTCVLPGSHHIAEKFYQAQRDAGPILGVEGAGWERLNFKAPNGLGLNYLPQSLWDQFTDESKYGPLERTSDGRKWPRPKQVLMEEGDACFTVYHVAHSATRNEHGTESRKNMIFRIRAKAHNPGIVASGVSDHLDRGQWGEWLDPAGKFHPFDNPVDKKQPWLSPFERSKHFLCHPWDVWEGMQGIVAEERAKEQTERLTLQPHKLLSVPVRAKL